MSNKFTLRSAILCALNSESVFGFVATVILNVL